MNLRTIAVVAALIVATTACLPVRDENEVASWLDSMSQGNWDRGWSHLSEQSKEVFGNSLDAYIADVDAVDWSRFQWTIGSSFTHDGIKEVAVKVEGGWEAVPEFMRERPLVQFACGSGGFLVYVFESRIGAGARTGSDIEGHC